MFWNIWKYAKMAVRKTGFVEYKRLSRNRKPSVPTPVFGGFRGTAVFCKSPIHAINEIEAAYLKATVQRLTLLVMWYLLVVNDPAACMPDAIIPHSSASRPSRKLPGAHQLAAELHASLRAISHALELKLENDWKKCLTGSAGPVNLVLGSLTNFSEQRRSHGSQGLKGQIQTSGHGGG
jgi:hypothetical protein